ncbi:hypothetical protein BL253_21130 [Pseudofrankia asymbiotica]|uniref:Uncharacterized protein n=1 Tax=Pseudofrankia asymbiotica TaxID=1834516 RepID=A0A1V2I9G2_9ACTN|nr:hypothetical protein BL253_21130 [Pseudofrankia asymbiotica]
MAPASAGSSALALLEPQVLALVAVGASPPVGNATEDRQVTGLMSVSVICSVTGSSLFAHLR